MDNINTGEIENRGQQLVAVFKGPAFGGEQVFFPEELAEVVKDLGEDTSQTAQAYKVADSCLNGDRTLALGRPFTTFDQA